jgi:hypothetical protein
MNEEYYSLLGKKQKYEFIGGLLLLVGLVSFLMTLKSLHLKGQWLVDEEGWHIESLDLFYSFLAIAGLLGGTLYIYKGHNLGSDIEEVKMLIQVERDRSFNERRKKRDRKREEKKKDRKEQEIKQKIDWANKLRDKGGLANLIKARSIYSECNYDVKKIEIEIAKDKEEHLDYDGALLDFERLGLYKSAKRIRQKIQEQKKAKQTIIKGDYIDDRDTTYIDDRDTIVKDSIINRSNIGAGEKSKAEQVQNIKELLDSDAIDEDEFKQMKKEILGK